jgi:glycosyltransferase involved in cell wall biosynthesis
MKQLSIIIPTYNNAKYLRRCFDSLLIQKNFTQLQIIVVNDGSTDESAKIINEYCAHYSNNFSALHLHNQGVSAARNAGLALVNSEYLTFLDADDWVSDSLYSISLAQMIAGNYDVLCYDFIEHWPDKLIHIKADTRYTRSKYYLSNVVWNKIYRSDFWRQNKFIFPMDVRFEDVWLLVEVCTKTDNFGFVTAADCHVNYDRTNLNSFMNGKRDTGSLVKVFEALLEMYSNYPDKKLLRFIATTFFFQIVLFGGDPATSWHIYCKYRWVFARINIESAPSKKILLLQVAHCEFILKGLIHLIHRFKLNSSRM